MKSKLQILSSISLVALLGSCATQVDEPTPIVTSPEFEYKTQQVESQSSIIPDWFKQNRHTSGFCRPVGVHDLRLLGSALGRHGAAAWIPEEPWERLA